MTDIVYYMACYFIVVNYFCCFLFARWGLLPRWKVSVWNWSSWCLQYGGEYLLL